MILNWDVALVQFVNEVRGSCWVWGRTDCACIARRALTVIHGRDVWDGVIGHWTTAEGAIRVLNSIRNPEMALQQSGGYSVSPRWQRAGDLVLGAQVGHDRMPQIGIIIPSGQVMLSSKEDGVYVLRHYSMLKEDSTYWRWGDHVE